MYCKDCFYYKKDRIEENDLVRGECLSKKFRHDHNLISADELVYWDSEDYSAGFYIGELFGCIHFKEPTHYKKLIKKIDDDIRILSSAVREYTEISNIDYRIDRYNYFKYIYVKNECDELIYDCKQLLEIIELKGNG